MGIGHHEDLLSRDDTAEGESEDDEFRSDCLCREFMNQSVYNNDDSISIEARPVYTRALLYSSPRTARALERSQRSRPIITMFAMTLKPMLWPQKSSGRRKRTSGLKPSGNRRQPGHMKMMFEMPKPSKGVRLSKRGFGWSLSINGNEGREACELDQGSRRFSD
ncbi:hypothetical protein BDV98DRAFT_594847 [Pterulicium gracile]|uniref:Uncharacterized protein n=1 Tax=Pterulicium gracile TaxID=1884261 RepID=A0A5C3QBU7_9AGAR|nr:hypothetical protein BDV98DRAFT_594847 [Pterula gracilis]